MGVRYQRGLECIAPYIPGKPIEEVKREYGLEDVIKLASNENPLGPSPKALVALQQALPNLNYYPDGQCFSLRQALSLHLQVPPEQIAVSNGADGLILELCMAYLDEGSEVVVSRSSFPIYDLFTHAMRGTLIKTPTHEYGLDLTAMADSITERTRLVFVCNPNNPTGTVVGAGEVDDFIQHVPEHVLIVLDEAYYHFVDTRDYPDSLRYIREGRPNVIVLRTFSKAYGLAGIRLGYGIAVPLLLDSIHKVREPFAVNLLAQAAGIGALNDEEFLRQTLDINAAGRRFFYQEFQRMGLFFVPSHTNFVLVNVGRNATEVCKNLLKHGLIVRPGLAYDLPQFLRITVGTATQNSRLVCALEEVLVKIQLS
ncbi:MAG: histidinol-phosphate transaminase [bacterium]